MELTPEKNRAMEDGATVVVVVDGCVVVVVVVEVVVVVVEVVVVVGTVVVVVVVVVVVDGGTVELLLVVELDDDVVEELDVDDELVEVSTGKVVLDSEATIDPVDVVIGAAVPGEVITTGCRRKLLTTKPLGHDALDRHTTCLVNDFVQILRPVV